MTKQSLPHFNLPRHKTPLQESTKMCDGSFHNSKKVGGEEITPLELQLEGHALVFNSISKLTKE